MADYERTKDENEERQELWRFYEKAIEGRDSFYKHYVQYMNLYAVFTGAFFVALYTILDLSEHSNNVLAVIITFLGLITSVLWFCSVKGYYAWIINWINIVKYYEELLNEGRETHEKRFVYGLFYDCEELGNGCVLTRPSRYSTQKLTLLFVASTILGWIVLLFCIGCGNCCVVDGESTCEMHNYVTAIAFALAIAFVLLICKRCRLKDDVSTHYQLKRLSPKHLFVEPPSYKKEC